MPITAAERLLRNPFDPAQALPKSAEFLRDSRHLRGGEGKETGWSAFLKHLKERGLKGVRRSPRMPALGLPRARPSSFQKLPGQRCVVHWSRNIFSHVPSTREPEIAAMLKAIHVGSE